MDRVGYRFLKHTLLAVGLLVASILGTCLRAQEDSLRIPPTEFKKAAVTKVNPEFPSMARQLHLKGSVDVDAYVTETGEVAKVQIVKGNPILASAAVAALKKWKFEPFKNEGKVVKAVGRMTFDFE